MSALEQRFEDHRIGAPLSAVIVSTYNGVTVHRAVFSANTARACAKEFGLPGIWRVKGGAA